MATGLLQVGVFNGSIALPLQNAAVQVSTDESLLYNIQTNVSGQTDVVELSAPAKNFSFEETAERPYSTCNISVALTGFRPVIVKGVQIFPDVTAFQRVFLEPTEAVGLEPQVFTIPAHSLWEPGPAKIPESMVKIPQSSEFIVLNETVVPEFIIVHDGEPADTSAPNYWIPYKDYIKNVASSEIYSTWPLDSIKSNVLAIISFTLNRVFTEWYPSRGYNFTITSSTAFDQKFVYQRNLFDEVSQVVDDIFSTYITKVGIEYPLFTQYCDGRSTTCPTWLSQWGTQQLAREGRSYIEILRYYYGQEIYLREATQVKGVPHSFPGQLIQTGSTGENVRTIQNQLNVISVNYPSIPRVAEDGIFGNSTLIAVESFQRIFRLPVTGIVDFATWYEISKVYVAVANLAESKGQM